MRAFIGLEFKMWVGAFVREAEAIFLPGPFKTAEAAMKHPHPTQSFVSQLSKANEVSGKVRQVFVERTQRAYERFNHRLIAAYADHEKLMRPMTPWELWANWLQYTIDTAQRSILFWDTLRKRGNNFIEHERAGKPPVLSFRYRVLLDARKFKRPVNYALLAIIAPPGVVTDPKRRPYVIIDPRAGHGPGIGGFKEDSEIGVALRDGHPVYFVTFFPEPEPGQTLLDVCAAEQEFVRKVRELHPDSPKPVVVGNCQGGWSAMMLAASDPELTGPLVINGAPMSYWGGAWSEGEGDNPMRYTGGLLGGSYLASFSADLGNGLFDGAELVQNFENLNPANTFWEKYYHLFSNVDTEPDRFLDFERWWGGFYLLNKKEIEWIVQNLFVGNRLWASKGNELEKMLDLRAIKSPIVMFASLGDNITPPQQAFNWIADVYSSTDEIKARGQVIVGLVHHDIGHLGIFVSGRVAKKEHAQIVSVLKSIEVLPPGLYGMHITEQRTESCKVEYKVEFVEHRLEEIVARLNRFKRADEKPFEAAAAISEFNQRAYEIFGHPWVRHFSNEYTALLRRGFHPLRVQRWALADLNPWMWWLHTAAEAVKANRQAVDDENQPFRHLEHLMSELMSASLDYYRDLRDATSEAMFFQTYAPLFLLGGEEPGEHDRVTDPRELPEVKKALGNIALGGYPEALSRMGYLLAVKRKPLPLARFELKQELMKKYHSFLPEMTLFQRRQIRGQQEIICRYEPEKAIATLPQLLSKREERQRFLTFLDLFLKDPRLRVVESSHERNTIVQRIRDVLVEGVATAA
jgi:pimeloyl-ACP methyl ester carboxylesterase